MYININEPQVIHDQFYDSQNDCESINVGSIEDLTQRIPSSSSNSYNRKQNVNTTNSESGSASSSGRIFGFLKLFMVRFTFLLRFPLSFLGVLCLHTSHF